ncbi:MAG: cation:proton antiporter [Bryobacteraceae bacterium]|nr:cation:proton antiporter [Bryobacteraceae bacterium]
MHAARTFSPQPGLGSGPAATTLGAGFILLAALFAGNLFRQLRLPQLTGYLVLGIVSGPHLMNLVSEPMLEQLRIFNGVAIALIALTAGTEMDFRTVRPLLRGILWMTLIAVLGTVLVITAAAFLLRELLPFTANLTQLQALAVALVLGVTMASQSPAVVVALRKEMDADGPLARTVLGVVVVSDLVVIVLFAVVSSVAKSLVGSGVEEAITGSALAWEIFGSGGAGLLIGTLIATYLRGVKGGGALFVITTGFLVAEVGQRVRLDPLLIGLCAGMLVRNFTRFGDRLHGEIEAASFPVYVSFFAVAGATIHLGALTVVGVPAAVFVLVRACSFLSGSRIAARVAGSPDVVRRFAGFGLLPQAGLALALALLFARSFPQFGEAASALVFAVVALNELAAPILYRWALVKSGEAGNLRVPAEAGIGLKPEEGLASIE